MDARKLKVYSDGILKANRTIAEETGQLPPRMVPEVEQGKYSYEIVGVDLNTLHQGWAQSAWSPGQFDPLPDSAPEPAAVPVTRPVPEEFMGREERQRRYYEKPSEPPPGAPPGEYVWVDD